jgi:hypothetical protein
VASARDVGQSPTPPPRHQRFLDDASLVVYRPTAPTADPIDDLDTPHRPCRLKRKVKSRHKPILKSRSSQRQSHTQPTCPKGGAATALTGSRRFQSLRRGGADRRSRRIKWAKALAQKEGIFTGISGGATFGVAHQIAERAPAGSVILCMLPDTGERYMTTPLFEGVETEMSEEEIALSRSTPGHQFPVA